VAGTPIDATGGVITLTLRGMGVAADRLAEQAEIESGTDAAMLADGWAAVTPLLGVTEDRTDRGRRALADALAAWGADRPLPAERPGA
jgi:hypothetical protein